MEALDDTDWDGVWYGFPMPNSAAKLMEGVALPSLPAVLGLTRLTRGGGGREVSGPIDGRLDLSLVVGIRLGISFDGLRSLSGLGPGADGVRSGASTAAACLGKVPARFSGSGSKSSCLLREPKPS